MAGWARNLSDGSVEVVLEGEREGVERMLEWCRRGPAGAAVESVRVTWEAPAGLTGFAIR